MSKDTSKLKWNFIIFVSADPPRKRIDAVQLNGQPRFVSVLSYHNTLTSSFNNLHTVLSLLNYTDFTFTMFGLQEFTDKLTII